MAIFDPDAYDVSSGFGIKTLEDLRSLGATEQQIRDIAARAPIIGEKAQAYFDFRPDQYNLASRGEPGFGMIDFDYLRSIGATDEQIRQVAARAPIVGPAAQEALAALPPYVFDPATYDVSTGFGMSTLEDLLNKGATREDILNIASRAPVVGERVQTLLPSFETVRPFSPDIPEFNYRAGTAYAPYAGLGAVNQSGAFDPRQAAAYDVSTGIGMKAINDLINQGATDQQLLAIASRAPVVGPEARAYLDEVVRSQVAQAPQPISLVQAPTEAPVLSPTVQTIGTSGPVEGMKKGGLAAVAQDLASKGRFGDTMVAHISPQEAGLLKALGGAGTINPETGLPEFFIDKIFGRGKLIDVNIGKKSQQALAIAAGVGAGLGYIPSFIPGLSPVASTALLTGGISALGNQNLSQGIQAGLSAYGAGSLTQALAPQTVAGAPTAPGGGTGSLSRTTAGVQSGAVNAPYDAVTEAYGPFSVESVPTTVPTATGADMGFDVAMSGGEIEPFMQGEVPLTATRSSTSMLPVSQQPLPYGQAAIPGLDPNVASTAATTAPDGFLAKTLPTGVQEYVPGFLLDASGTTLAGGAVLGSGLVGGIQERKAFARQQAALQAAQEEKRRRDRELFERTLGAVPARSGGLMSLAKGGMTYMEAGGTTGPTGAPRDVTGTGDGMSDSVPATIEGVQEARLADGEFVIPADVVADIGNGSSDAGSKKLYAMMDRIRKARHGTTEQPPEINAEALMPA